MANKEEAPEQENNEMTELERAELTLETHMEIEQAKEVVEEHRKKLQLEERKNRLQKAREERQNHEEAIEKIGEKAYAKLEKAYDYLLQGESLLKDIDKYIQENKMQKVNRHTVMNKIIENKSPTKQSKGVILKGIYGLLKFYAGHIRRLTK